MNLIILVLLILVLINLQVLYREIRRMRKQTNLGIQGLHARLEAIAKLDEIDDASFELTPALSARVEALVAGGNEAEAISEICDAFCLDYDAAAKMVEQHGVR